MATCPLCEAQIDGDFGLVECTGCGAQLIMHVDGRLEHQGAALAEDLVSDVPYTEPPPLPDIQENDATPPLEQEFEAEVISDDPEDQSDVGTVVGAEVPEAQDMPVAGGEAVSTPEYSFDDDAAPEPTPAYITAASPDSPDMSDVANFGNSGISGARDGSLRYTLTIEGIDTSDVRNAFREAITDRKLMWDIETILKSVRNGQVTIPNVSPSKAFMVISRLRSLPVRVQWEQYAVQQT